MDMERLIKNIIRGISAILLLLFFVPTFCVSCGGEILSFSPMEIANGVTIAGESDDPHLAVYVLLLLPVIIFAITFLKDVIAEKTLGFMIAATGIVDMIGWLVFKQKVIEYVAYCNVFTKASYVFDLILTFAAGGLGIIYAMNKELFADLKKDEPKKAEPKKDDLKKDEPKEDESKKGESKKEEAKKEESKKAEAKEVESKKENYDEVSEPEFYNNYEDSPTLPADIVKSKVNMKRINPSSGSKMSDEFKTPHF